VRDKQGTLRAFSNVCRHRAGPIAQGSGSKNVFRCAYHGWTYTLDGRLIGTPDVDGIEFFDRSTMGMVPLRCESWEQFIFVNFDLHAEPLSTFLGKIPEQCRGFEFAGLELAEHRDYFIDCNWKVYVDNYLEGYHIPIAHPGLMREIDYLQYRTDTFRYHSQQFAPLRALKPDSARIVPAASSRTEQSDALSSTFPTAATKNNCHSEPSEESAFSSAPTADRVYAPGSGSFNEALYFWIFPNLMLNIYPDNIQTNIIVPLGHAKTLTIFEWFFHDVKSERVRERVRKTIAFSDEVQQEDIDLCHAVQRGLHSATYERGRYSPKRENGVHHFHLLVGEFLGRP
jgi:choline monooxygenase